MYVTLELDRSSQTCGSAHQAACAALDPVPDEGDLFGS
jgi:hypothetical protein